MEKCKIIEKNVATYDKKKIVNEKSRNFILVWSHIFGL